MIVFPNPRQLARRSCLLLVYFTCIFLSPRAYADDTNSKVLESLASKLTSVPAKPPDNTSPSTDTKPSPKPNRKCDSSDANVLLERSYRFQDKEAIDFPIELPLEIYGPEAYAVAYPPGGGVGDTLGTQLTKGPTQGRVIIKISRPDAIEKIDWQNSIVIGTAFAGSKEHPTNQIRVPIAIREKNADTIVASLSMPPSAGRLHSQEWTIVPIVCGGKPQVVLGAASAKVSSVPIEEAWAWSIGAVLIFWILISAAAYNLHKSNLDTLWKNKEKKNKGILKEDDSKESLARLQLTGRRPSIQKYLWASSPLFISQDSLGYGSLARFQILIFTTSVGFVLLIVFVHSGFISNVSDTVLLLLGVTVAGGTLARAVGDGIGISAKSRSFLIGGKILEGQKERPYWTDLLETQGEIDVAKVQALLFTFFISLSIFASGAVGLSSFNLPAQIVYLSFISQGAYVAGKILPADTRKTVEQDLEFMRAAARALVAKSGDKQLEVAYEQARQAAKSTLEQTYSERFRAENFKEKTDKPEDVI